ncbi:hypothetical protein HY389_02150, partial [Candidatus Daviesbacteria bacterium]|nr:hypothetical protein [Candidatus Daviesbacteria bacterium]
MADVKFDPQLYKDAAELIRLYTTNSDFKSRFNQALAKSKTRALFKGRPLTRYLNFFEHVTPKYASEFKGVRIGFTSEKFAKLAATYYQDTSLGYGIISRAAQTFESLAKTITPTTAPTQPTPTPTKPAETKPQPISPPQGGTSTIVAPKIASQPKTFPQPIHEVEKITTVTPSTKEVEVAAPVVVGVEETRPSFHLPSVPQVPNVVKNVGVKAEISTSKFLNFLPSGIKSFFVGGLKGTSSAAQIAGKTALTGAGKLAGGLLANVIPVAGQIASGIMLLTSTPLIGKPVSKGVRWLIIGIVVILLLIFILIPMGLLQTNTLLTLFTNTQSSTQPIPPGTIPSDLSSCQFYRGGDGPNSAKSFKSSKLLSYIQEASSLSGVPAVVLAAFMRVESPIALDKTDAQIDNYECSISSTGALGIMQIQPPRTIGHDGIAINNGARFISKNTNTLTQADYCDPRTSIIIASGFILKKLQYAGFGDGTTWNQVWTTDQNVFRAMASGYYGCDLYGGPVDCVGPYSYSQDLTQSIQACSSVATRPPDSPQYKDLYDLANQIQQNFSVTIAGPADFTNQQLEDIYKTLAALFQSQKYAQTLRSIQPFISLDTSIGSCFGATYGKSVHLGKCSTFDGVAYVVPHELGHTIQSFSGSLYRDYLNSVADEYGLIFTYPYRYTNIDLIHSENFA